MRIAFPEAVHQVPLRSTAAVPELTKLIASIRDNRSATADLEALASETVQAAEDEGAVLLAMIIPAGADPAMLTGVVMEAPDSWDLDHAEAMRDALEDRSPSVRETAILDTALGPAVLAHCVPGVERVRAREPLALQLQAFITEPGSAGGLLLTLSCPSARGWDVHQRLFAELVASASASAPAANHDESFEHRTYQL